jgi:hypothetical protein
MYQTKLDEACALLLTHFTAVHTRSDGKLHPEDATKPDSDVKGFLHALKKAGGTDDEALKQCTWEDLESFGAPRLLAKRVAAIFRGKTETTPEPKTNDPKLLKPARVAVMSVQELVQFYDPREATNAVAERINKIAAGKRCIVFNADNSVNVDASVTLLNELRDGFGERETFPVGGVPTKVFKVGERVGQLADENPLYPARPLRPNGDCDQTNRSWTGVSEVARKVVFLARSITGEVKIDSLMDAHSVLDFVVGADEAKVRSRFSKASLLYDDLKEKGGLPSLKISLKGGANGNKPNDPFGAHKTY